MKRKLTMLTIGGVVMCAALAGCGSEEVTEDTTELSTEAIVEIATVEDATPDDAEHLKTIGEESDDCYDVELKNSTGQDIVEIQIYNSVTDEYGENLLDEDDAFLADEVRILYCDRVSDGTEESDDTDVTDDTSADEDAPSDKYISVGYDVKIVLADETEYVLHSFPFEDIKAGEILVEDEVAFVEYNDYSTKDAELAIKEAEDAAASVESGYTPSTNSTDSSSVSTPAATEAPASNSTSESGSYDSGSSDSGSSDSGSSDAGSDSSADVGDQESENCIGDEGLTY